MNKIFYFMFLVLFVLIIPLSATQYTIQWIDTLALSHSPSVYDMTLGPNKTIYITGNANSDFFTAKFDSMGNMLWSDSLDTGNYDYAYGIATDTLGNAYVAGYMQYYVNSVMYTDYITAKYNSSGIFVWEDTLNIGSNDYNIGGISVSNNNYIYLGGGSNITGDYQFLIYKYDPDGNLVREDTSSFVGTNNRIVSVATDANNNYYFTGLVTIGTSDYYTAKYDTSGSIAWADTFDNGFMDHPADITLDGYGNVCITGYYTVDTNNKMLTIKYNPSGTIIWTDTIEHTRGSRIAADQDGNVYVTGCTTNGNSYMLTIKYDPNGNIVWADTIDNGSNDCGEGIALDKNGNIYVVGNSTIGGYYNILIVKYENTQGIQNKKNDYDSSVFKLHSAMSGNNIIYSVGNSGMYSLAIITPTGRCVKAIKTSGKGEHILHLKQLSSGIYFVRFKQGNIITDKKITIMR